MLGGRRTRARATGPFGEQLEASRLAGFSAVAVADSSPESSALGCIEAAPDTCRLVRAERVLEARFLNGAGCADRFGFRRSRFVFNSGKEHITGNTATSRIFAPICVWLPHDITQSQQRSAFLSAKTYNAHAPRDNSRIRRFFRIPSRKMLRNVRISAGCRRACTSTWNQHRRHLRPSQRVPR